MEAKKLKIYKRLFTTVVVVMLLFSGTFVAGATLNTRQTVTNNPQPPQTQNYDDVNLPADLVTMTILYNRPTSTFMTTLSNVPLGYDVTDGNYLGWCNDPDTWMPMNVPHQVILYSSYNSVLPSYLENAEWDKVNYLLNHKLGNSASWDYCWQIQFAIWYLLGYGDRGMQFIGAPMSSNAWAMVNDANTYGEGYTPVPGEIMAILADAGANIQGSFFEIIVTETPLDYESDTAWVFGTRYVKKGNWAWYYTYEGADDYQPIYAGQIKLAGYATFSAVDENNEVTITIFLENGFVFFNDPSTPYSNLHIQDYAVAPNTSPSPGLFDYHYAVPMYSTQYSVTVPANNYYGIHLVVGSLPGTSYTPIWYAYLTQFFAKYPNAFPILRTLLHL
jgi:hypothetical protein